MVCSEFGNTVILQNSGEIDTSVSLLVFVLFLTRQQNKTIEIHFSFLFWYVFGIILFRTVFSHLLVLTNPFVMFRKKTNLLVSFYWKISLVSLPVVEKTKVVSKSPLHDERIILWLTTTKNSKRGKKPFNDVLISFQDELLRCCHKTQRQLLSPSFFQSNSNAFEFSNKTKNTNQSIDEWTVSEWTEFYKRILLLNCVGYRHSKSTTRSSEKSFHWWFRSFDSDRRRFFW